MRSHNPNLNLNPNPADACPIQGGLHNQWSLRSRWTDMRWPATCLTFCSSSGMSELLRSATTMLAGSRTLSRLNAEESNNNKSCSRAACSDPETERAKASQGSSNDKATRGNSASHEPSLRHSGLDVPGLNRMNEFKQKVFSLYNK